MGASLALLAAVVALHMPPPATHDTLYTFLGDRGPVYLDYGAVPPVASKLRVFRTHSRLWDVLPRSLYAPSADWNYEPSKSRLLFASGRVLLYGIPEQTGGVCFYIHDPYHGYCVDHLLHGAYPFVDAHTGEAFGLLGDRARRVTVDGRLAMIGKNAFYIRASHVDKVVVTDRDGWRHVYTFTPCEVIDYNDMVYERIVEDPMYPVPDYCY
jgi:hypothetical protein